MLTINYQDILEQKNIDFISNILNNDGLIIYPTDTLYGLGGNFFSPIVTKKIDALKNRQDMPYSVAVPGMSMLKRLVENIPPYFRQIHSEYLPGKFTFLFNVAVPFKPLVKNSDKIGIRIPAMPKILKLMEILNIPLISTSVNKTGQPALNDPAKIIDLFSKFSAPGVISTESSDVSPALLIDAGVLPESKGSTIYDLTTSPCKCLRHGDNRIENIEKITTLLT